MPPSRRRVAVDIFSGDKWLFVIAMAFTIIPVDIVRKLIVGGSK